MSWGKLRPWCLGHDKPPPTKSIASCQYSAQQRNSKNTPQTAIHLYGKPRKAEYPDLSDQSVQLDDWDLGASKRRSGTSGPVWKLLVG